MLVVLDTNVLLQARAAGHPYHVIMQAWLNGRLTLAMSTEVMLEYEEVITARAGASRWETLEKLLKLSEHVRFVSPTYRFQLVRGDPDDNKFADCAIVAEAGYIVTEDRAFQVMQGSGFKPQVISPQDFKLLL